MAYTLSTDPTALSTHSPFAFTVNDNPIQSNPIHAVPNILFCSPELIGRIVYSYSAEQYRKITPNTNNYLRTAVSTALSLIVKAVKGAEGNSVRGAACKKG